MQSLHKAMHVTNIITNAIVRVVMTICITIIIIKFSKWWLSFFYLIPGCMMSLNITTQKGGSDESNNNEQAR